ncbi:L-aspartate oxidase [Clostridium sp. D2Q-14]|uniref:L-aspartate oxidase n=1 Tax=Anaeromonas gelatinilytica TaxID=2683194 RepID=UPI00193C5B0C|nr:L-aspartate oxidase [Anaeromonas gelatinilytica]MBS4534667.1 L-aspartate oxidase [Anaeromonas gelatinilytica]
MIANNQPDVIIIGGGIAGLYTALNIDSSLNVLILSKKDIENTSSILAQGGVAACLDKEDLNLYIEDTLIAGSEKNNINSLNTMISESKDNIKRLMELGVEFDRDINGNFKKALEGGHSSRRIFRAGGDSTGKEIIYSLRDKANNQDNIQIWDNSMVMNIDKKDNHFLIKLIKEDKLIKIVSNTVVIATGGIGGIYKNSTNPMIATGDGIVLAYRLGCELDNLEYIQFHPTAFYNKKSGERFLISEAVRGEGAYLRNSSGERFMLNAHPKGELAPRDIVARSIFKEMKKSNIPHMFLDITHKEKNYLMSRFPVIYNKCLSKGIDMSENLVPIVPVEHYFIGGIKTNIEGRTNIEGIYACGECANTGVHGANRLASNSLLECIVFGRRIANNINNDINNLKIKKKIRIEIIDDIEYNLEIEDIKKDIRNIMDKYVGIVREKKGLHKAKFKIKDILQQIDKFNLNNKDYVELQNMALMAYLIIKSCIYNKESIGCHYRID